MFLAFSASLLVAGCGDDESASSTSAAATQAKPAEVAAAPASSGAYTAVSDVDAHAAIGKDVAAIRAALEPAEGAKPDFKEAKRIWSAGENSKKDDGSLRTLAGFVEEAEVGAQVLAALDGNGTAKKLTDAQRGQWIDKGMTVALALKVLGELDTAKEKIAANEIDPAEGAPHNVDEAWAFFLAEDQGVGLTAQKRAKDFKLGEDELSAPVLTGLAAAQKAAGAGDADALDRAREIVRGGLNRIFALAIKKYAVEGLEDDVARAEGQAFAWGLTGAGASALTDAAASVFSDGATEADVESLDRALDAAAADLGIDGELPDYEAGA